MTCWHAWPLLVLTGIGLQVLRGNHDNKSDGTFIPEHFIGPSANWAHALDSSDSIVCNEHLKSHRTQQSIPRLGIIQSNNEKVSKPTIHGQSNRRRGRQKALCVYNDLKNSQYGVLSLFLSPSHLPFQWLCCLQNVWQTRRERPQWNLSVGPCSDGLCSAWPDVDLSWQAWGQRGQKMLERFTHKHTKRAWGRWEALGVMHHNHHL